MTISDKTRKVLWARSGNCCAFCRCELVMAGTADVDSVVGDECHIVSSSPGGPRHEPGAASDADGYDNLILLCRTHHKLVDDQPTQYSAERLRAVKSLHEQWVRDTLAKDVRRSGSGQAPSFRGLALLPRIRTGKELLNLIGSTHVYILDNDELSTMDEADSVGGLLSEIRDLYDILGELDPAEVARNQVRLNCEIHGLEQAGFLVFGIAQRRRLRLGQVVDTYPVATICVVRRTNKAVCEVEGQEYLLTLLASAVAG